MVVLWDLMGFWWDFDFERGNRKNNCQPFSTPIYPFWSGGPSPAALQLFFLVLTFHSSILSSILGWSQSTSRHPSPHPSDIFFSQSNRPWLFRRLTRRMTDHGINQFSPGPCAYTSTDTQSAFHKHLAWVKAKWAQFALIGESWDKLSVLFVSRV